MNLEDALPTFIAESRELLDEMETALLSLDSARDAEPVNAIFRAAHTMKGSAGLFGLDAVVAFTHVAESVLDRVRGGEVTVDPALVSLLLTCCDHMRALIDEVAGGRPGDDNALQKKGQPLLEALQRHLACASAVSVAEAVATEMATSKAMDKRWHISVQFGPDVLRNGMDPASIVRYLASFGRIDAIRTVTDALPGHESMDPESCYLGLEIDLETVEDEHRIRDAFQFMLEDCTLHVHRSSIGAGEAATCTTTTTELSQSTAINDPSQKAKDARNVEKQTVRVDSDKLDRLIDLVGELIIAQATASMAALRPSDFDVHEAHSALAGLVQSVRDSALQLRMVKIGGTFSRFQRVVHDVSRELGKDIALVIRGENTELDKTVVEKIGDPLTHLVRNAMDHGIGTPQQRRALGQPERGTITLAAHHEAGNVVIEVRDDGQGLDRDRILAKAIERGLVGPDRTLSDAEVFDLVFEPGFSTAEQVTNLSGRGVGMDVVRRNITALRGTVGISSQPGQGTQVTVRLPLTLAIIKGFQVAVGDSVFVVPLESVEECVEYRSTLHDGHDYTDLRGLVLPLIRLRKLFDIPGAPRIRQNVVVLRYAGQKVGLVVDSLLGEAQTVIKPLSKMFSEIRGISGSSIRGTGEVALILDVPALIDQATRSAKARTDVADSPAA